MDRATFFSSLYKNSEGRIEIRPLPGKPGFFKLDDFSGIDSYCHRYKKSNLYFGVATRDGKGGRKENIIHIPACWVDVDFKDISMDDFAKRLKKFPYRPSVIVLSGNGTHLYWFFREPLKKKEMLTVEDLNRRIAKSLAGDLNACDAARILRIPETINHKYPKPVKVHRLDAFTYEPENFLDILPEVPPPTSSNIKNIKGNAIDKIMSCDFLNWCKNNSPDVSEPLWYALVSNVICIRPEGYSLCHKLSKGYPGYSREETDRKIHQALDASAPHTCEYIQSNGFNCSRNCNVKAPAVLLLKNQLDRQRNAAPDTKDSRANVSFS